MLSHFHFSDMRRELIESYYEEYQRELERFLESDPEMFSLEAEIHHYIEILEPVLRDAGYTFLLPQSIPLHFSLK